MHHFAHLAIDTHIEEALAAHLLEELAVVSLAGLDERSQDEDGTALIVFQYEVDNLLLGILDHLLARSVGVGLAGTGKEQAQVVVHLGDGAHSGAGILIGGLLLYGDHGRESCDLVYIGTLHATEEVAGIGREGLYIAALTLGKEGIECQGGLAATAQTGNHRERAVRDGGIDILQVMLAGSVDFDAVLTLPKGGRLAGLVLCYLLHSFSSFLERVSTLISPRRTYLMPSEPSASTRMKYTPSSTLLP